MSDILMLGGLVFTDFSVPDRMPFGGKQSMAIHKLPGGKRVIDTLGPDDSDFSWSGQFFGDGSYAKAMALDGMRAAGEPIPLMWGGQFWLVIVANVDLKVARLPLHVEYSVTVVVAESPGQGGGLGGLMGFASGLGGLLGGGGLGGFAGGLSGFGGSSGLLGAADSLIGADLSSAASFLGQTGGQTVDSVSSLLGF